MSSRRRSQIRVSEIPAGISEDLPKSLGIAKVLLKSLGIPEDLPVLQGQSEL